MEGNGDEQLSRKVTPEIIDKLREIVGKDNVNTSEIDRMLYSHDLAPLPKEAGFAFKNIPDVVVRPSTVKQLSRIAVLAFKTGVALTPRGASTWGLGGSMPVAGGILIDMSSKFNKNIIVDKVNMTVKADAGCTWKQVMDACEKEGLLVGSTPSSFPSATLGGWVSTGGIGIGGYKYGGARESLMNLEVVLSDGTILNTGYDNVGNNMSGYNLNQLFAGAEGTLGLIATVTLRVYPKGVLKFLGYDFDSLKDMHQPIQEIVQHPSVKPLHVAWSDENHFENQRKAGIHAPDVKNLFLVTLQGASEFVDLEEKVIDDIVSKAGGKKVSPDIAEHEWEERCYEYRCRKAGVGSIPAEVIVEVQHWGEFVDECYKGFEKMKMEPGGIVGMISDRSTAMFMPYYFKDDETLLGMAAFAYNFYMGDRCVKYGGRSLGLGVFFASNLDVIRDEGSASLIRDIKTLMDPHDVMNPGHLVCGRTRFGLTLGKNLMGIASKLMCYVKRVLPKDTIFQSNISRFHYDELEEEKKRSLVVEYGKGTQ
ncbi:MAG: FAD-binding oxidoreductase [archaeon]|nr:FAD-binding oxidoreductase [archaeon]